MQQIHWVIAVVLAGSLSLMACQPKEQETSKPKQEQMTKISTSNESNTKSQPSESGNLKTNQTLATKTGKERYDASCKVCHDSGLLNAPRIGNKSEWIGRQEKPLDVLYLHSIKGFNRMPAQAVNGVSEEEVKSAVDYMLSFVK